MKNFFVVCIIFFVVVWFVIVLVKEGIYIIGKVGIFVVNVYGINLIFSQDEIVNGYVMLFDCIKGVFGGGVVIGYDFYDLFQFLVCLELDIIFRGEMDVKGGQDIIVFGQLVYINVKNQV